MDVAALVALTTLVATFFAGLVAVLKYSIQLATLIKAHGELVSELAAQLESSTLVLLEHHPPG